MAGSEEAIVPAGLTRSLAGPDQLARRALLGELPFGTLAAE